MLRHGFCCCWFIVGLPGVGGMCLARLIFCGICVPNCAIFWEVWCLFDGLPGRVVLPVGKFSLLNPCGLHGCVYVRLLSSYVVGEYLGLISCF